MRQGIDNIPALEEAQMLMIFQRSLFSPYCPWTDDEKAEWIAWMTDEFGLIDIPYTDYDMYVVPTVVLPDTANGDYVTHAQLDDQVQILENADQALSDRITALEEFDYSSLIPQELLDQVAENTAEIADIQADLDELIDAVIAVESGLAAHIADNSKHLQAGERTSWNGRVTQAELTTGLSGKANSVHTHNITDITGLNSALTNLQNQINSFPEPEDGDDGITPTISIGTVEVSDPPYVELDPASTIENPILNFGVPQGPAGEDFEFDATDTFANRSLYDAEDPGFKFLAYDTGRYYVMTDTGWGPAIQFAGYNGWSPKLALYTVSPVKEVFEVMGWIGGTGTPPQYPIPDGVDPDTVRFFIADSGITTYPEMAKNVKGPQGADGPVTPFTINATGSDRSIYDAQPRGFTFLDSVTGKVSFKLTDTNADWSAEYQWTGPSGPPASAWADLVANTSVAGNGFTLEITGLGGLLLEDGQSELSLNGDQTWKLGNNDMGIEATAGNVVKVNAKHAGFELESTNMDQSFSGIAKIRSSDDVTQVNLTPNTISAKVDDGSDSGEVFVTQNSAQVLVNGEGLNVSDSFVSIDKSGNAFTVSEDSAFIDAEKLNVNGEDGLEGQFIKSNGSSAGPQWAFDGTKRLIEITAHGFDPLAVLGINETGTLDLYDGSNEYAGVVVDVINTDQFVLQNGGFIEDPGIDEGEFWYVQDDGTLDPLTPSDVIGIIGVAAGIGALKPALGGSGSGGAVGLGDVLDISNDADGSQITNLADGTSDDHAVNVGQMNDAIDSSVASSAALLRQNLGMTAHGFSVGDCLTIIGTDYELITDPSTQVLVGIVISVADVNNFELQLGGWSAHLNLAAGDYYVQSDGTLDTVVTPLYGYRSMGPFWGHIPARVPMSAGGGGAPARDVFAFNSSLFTEDSKMYRGILTALSGYTSAALSGVTFEVRLDSSSSWTAQANIAAVESWIGSNVSGNSSTGTKFWIKVLASYTGTGIAQYVMTYTPS